MSKKPVKTKSGTPTERPPIVAIMGHIDHGKSTLLDYIRKSNTVDSEVGGITQHVSAYEVSHPVNGIDKKITFLDTPGHEAFGAIRTRGADIADIVILVVSAEDGVKPQTIEAIKAIKKSETPFIVAINKIDKPEADVNRTKQTLSEHEVYVEEYGGDIPSAEVSAKTGEGVPDLLDLLLLVVEMQELTATPNIPAEGIIIESNVDQKKGLSGTLIITNGTLSQGQFVVTHTAYAPVRIMEDFTGTKITEATFSSPIHIIGWSALPLVGNSFITLSSKKEAEAYILSQSIEPSPQHGVNDPSGKPIIPLIIEADAAGSLDAILHEINKLSTERVEIKILKAGIGNITEGDIKLAGGNADSVIIAFNTSIDNSAKSFAERACISISFFDIIYKMSEWLEEAILSRTPSIEVEEENGNAKVLRTFSKNKNHQIIGGKVRSGSITLGTQVKIMRRDVELGKGIVKELQQQKVKSQEIRQGYEFGGMIDSSTEIAQGDTLISFTIVKK